MEKNDNIFRIIITGDSFTMGMGIENCENVYPPVLQKKLDERYGKGKFEVINLAKSGYSTINVVDSIKDIGLKLDPDLIIYGYYPNDAEGPDSKRGFNKGEISALISKTSAII